MKTLQKQLLVCLFRLKVRELSVLLCIAIIFGLPDVGAAAGPEVGMSWAGTNLSIYWPVIASNFTLETSSRLPGDWWPATNKIVAAGTNLVALDRATEASQFFRLREKEDFYGKRIGWLKLFCQKRWGDTAYGSVNGQWIYQGAGVIVDRNASPNIIYVADTGHSRILGFRSFNSPVADLVFGQPDESASAANGDCNLGMYGPTTRSNLCLMAYPWGSNVAEQWLRLNFDVDGDGNLYFPDFANNRVLVYFAPFSADKTGGKGDTLPDFVIGQDSWTSNGVNRGLGPATRDAHSLFLSYGGFDHVASRGVSVDTNGNVWVADTFNYRVLRFPRGATIADLVLGQPNFTVSEPVPEAGWPSSTNAPLNRTCTPTLAKVDASSGELYVVDEYPGGFRARILVFRPPFTNGMAASKQIVPRQTLAGDYAGGYTFTHATGLEFNRFKTDDWCYPENPVARYRDGVLWLQDGSSRVLLLDGNGEILLAIGAPDTISYGGQYWRYGVCGQDPLAPFNLVSPGGTIGFDSHSNIYLADGHTSRIARYGLPYRVTTNGTYRCMPDANGGMFGNTTAVSVGPDNCFADRVGVLVHRGQLILRDHQRYMVWTNYLRSSNGAPADLFAGQPNGFSISNRNGIMGRAMHAVDDQDHLWATGEHSRLYLWQLPFTNGAPTSRDIISLYWADDPNQEVDYRCSQPVAFDPVSRKLWVFDNQNYRLLRISNYTNWHGKLLVDVVIGQTNKVGGQMNRGMSAPDAASFGAVNDLKFDRLGNLFVVDNTYECHPNGRVVAFLADDLAAITNMFPAIQAKRVYCVESFTQTSYCRIHDPVYGDTPFSPVCVAFNSRNEMVIGNDGGYRYPEKRALRQLYLYKNPLTKTTPDAWIELPMGAPGEITFDSQDNLIVQDHTWNRVWIINYDWDPNWLQPIPWFP
jgi:hypothetical protein